MKIPSNKNLGKIAVYGAVAIISGVMYMRYKIQDRIRNTDYFRGALKELRKNPGAIKLLGEPIKEVGFDLSDDDKAFCDGQRAQFVVSVRGSKDRGTIFFWSERSDTDGWVLKKLELEIKSEPDKRFIVKKLGTGTYRDKILPEIRDLDHLIFCKIYQLHKDLRRIKHVNFLLQIHLLYIFLIYLFCVFLLNY